MHDDDIIINTDDQNNVFTINTPEVFTRYPDLDARSVQKGLGVDVISDLRKILDERK